MKKPKLKKSKPLPKTKEEPSKEFSGKHYLKHCSINLWKTDPKRKSKEIQNIRTTAKKPRVMKKVDHILIPKLDVTSTYKNKSGEKQKIKKNS